MNFEFHASTCTDSDLLATLQEGHPDNPFLTPEFVRYRAALGRGATPWIVGVASWGTLQSGCIGYLDNSRLPWNSAFEIHSLLTPAGDAAEVFWQGLWAFCRKHRIGRLTLLSFASRAPLALPSLPGQLWQRSRCEYVLELPEFTAATVPSSNHRRNLRRAERAGIVVRETREDSAAQVHGALMGQSMERRHARGESVTAGDDAGPTRRLLAMDTARLYQAVQDQTVLSSILVLRARDGAYYHSAGTSPAGMQAGASHLLITRLAESLREDGCRVFNLGGTDTEGLARFKAGFGAKPITLAAASYFTGNRVARMAERVSSRLRGYVS